VGDASAGKKGVKHPKVGSYQGEVSQASPPFTGFARLQVFKPKNKGGPHRVLIREAPAVVTCPNASGFPFVEVTGDSDMTTISNKGGFFSTGFNRTIQPNGGTELANVEVRGKFVSKRVATGTVKISYTQDWNPGLPCYQVEGTSGLLSFRVALGPYQPPE
jgi:hypothetical protein